MRKLLSQLFIPFSENDFRPLLLRAPAFLVYGMFAIIVFASFTQLWTGDVRLFLADLSQELVVSEANKSREQSGLGMLQVNEKLTNAAQLKAEDMVVRDYFSHIGPEGEKPWVWLDKIGYSFAGAAENLAIDVADPKLLMRSWLSSPTHAANFENGYFNEIGIGIQEGMIDGRNTTVVVAFLGRGTEFASQAVISGSLSETLPEGGEGPKESLVAPLPQEPMLVSIEEGAVNEGGTAITGGARLTGDVADEGAQQGALNFFRVAVTLLFLVLAGWSFYLMLSSQKKSSYVTLRMLGFLALITILWGPELIQAIYISS